MKILMVCLGNICRSPLAEGILQEKAKRAGLNWMVESAGTNGFHTGEPPHTLSQKVARLNGIDISKQRARRFMKSDIDGYDKIYEMADDVLNEMKRILAEKPFENKVEFFLDSLYPGKNMDVPDPWYGPEKGYHEVYELIEKACDAIIEKYMVSVKITESI
jgi:protein-tyrosine phosphatase